MSKCLFSEAQRETIKMFATPIDVLTYIETLETVARAALDLWKQAGMRDHTGDRAQYLQASSTLYDALAAVDFMEAAS